MKKLLSILGSIGLVATASSAVVSCIAIQNTGNNTLNANGEIAFKTKVQFNIKEGAQITTTGAEDGYAIVKSSDLGDINNKNVDGIDVAMTTNTDYDGLKSNIDSKYVAKGVTYQVKLSDLKDNYTGEYKLKKQVKAYIYVTIPHDTEDADGNIAAYKFTEQHFSWTMIAYNHDGTIESYAEVAQINIPATSKPAINGAAAISKDKKTVTVYGINLYKIDMSTIKNKLQIDGNDQSDVTINNNTVVIKLDSPLASGNHRISWIDDQLCEQANSASVLVA